MQRTIGFSVSLKNGQQRTTKRIAESILNHPYNLEKPVTRLTPLELRAQMLKRIARRAMTDVTECQPSTIAAQVSRIRDLEDIYEFELRHDYRETQESIVSATPTAPYTLADYLQCLRMTRRDHRAPEFVNQRDSDIADIKRMISSLAGLLASNPEALELFQRQFDKTQTEEAV